MAPRNPSAPPSPDQLRAANMQARNIVLAAGVPRMQQIYSTSKDPAQDNVHNVVPKNVGLIRGFLVKVEGTFINSDAGVDVAQRTPFGNANALSKIQFTDMDGVTRHNCPGRALSMINSAKQPLVQGGAYAPNVPMGFGSNWEVEAGAATIAKGATSKIQHYYYVPLAYTKLDLRGAMWAGVVNSTASLQLTVNAEPRADAGDLLNAMYSGIDAGGWQGNVAVTVWQDYIDQVPYAGEGANRAPILPYDDVSTIYSIQTTTMNGLVNGAAFGIPYANFKNFLSTTVVLNNGVAPFLNAGTEITQFALVAANASQLFGFGPEEAAFFARGIFAADPPLGCYYFSHRDRPINTQNFGNIELQITPNANINAAAYLDTTFEYFANVNQVTFATALPNG